MENPTGRMGVGIISAGKVGAPLGSALRAAGHQIIGAYAKSEQSRERLEAVLPGVPALEVERIVERAELVVLAVPDAQLPGLVERLAEQGAWQAGQIVFHTAPKWGIDVLRPAAKAGALTLALHPAMSFTGTSLDVARLADAYFAISAPNALLPIGQALVAEMGGTGVVVNSADRPAYAAAMEHAKRVVRVGLGQSRQLFESVGVPAQISLGIIAGEVERALGEGSPKPPTVEMDREPERFEVLRTLAQESADFVPLARTHAELTAQLAALAVKAGYLSAEQGDELHAMARDLGRIWPRR